MQRKIGIILGFALLVEIVVAVVVVMAQPGGFSGLLAVGGGPERRQTLAERNFPLNGQATRLKISSLSGDVKVIGDATVSQVRLNATKIVNGYDDSVFDKIKFEAVQENNEIRLEGKREPSFTNNAKIDIEVRVPPALVAALVTELGSADVTINGLSNEQGTFDIRTGSGEVKASDIKAATFQVRTGSGEISFNNFSGGLNLETGSGEIKLEGANLLKSVRLQTSSGDINAKAELALSSNGSVNTASGEVNFTVVGQQTPGFEINTGSGDISVKGGLNVTRKEKRQLVTSGSPLVTIRTGSGDISIK